MHFVTSSNSLKNDLSVEFASIFSVWHTQVLGGRVASLLVFFSAQNYICQCFNGLHDSKAGHQRAFCSLRTRNWWSRDPRQCSGAHSYMDAVVLYQNHRKQAKVLFISLPSYHSLFPIFCRAGKDKVWLPDMGFGVFWSAGSPRTQKPLSGSPVLHPSVLIQSVTKHGMRKSPIFISCSSKHLNYFLRSSQSLRFTWGLVLDGWSPPDGELGAAAAQSKCSGLDCHGGLGSFINHHRPWGPLPTWEPVVLWFSFSFKKWGTNWGA